jgi:hypothetical protein
MKAWPISSRVNSPKNDDAEIIVPVEVEPVARSENQPQLPVTAYSVEKRRTGAQNYTSRGMRPDNSNSPSADPFV